MGYIFRAFYAPMPNACAVPPAFPTNVPFLFATMVKRLLREQKPDYLAVVYDVALPLSATSSSPNTKRSARPCPKISPCSFRTSAATAKPCACPSSNIPATKPTT